jgi:TPR repeat protein
MGVQRFICVAWALTAAIPLALAASPDILKLQADCAGGTASACGKLGGLYLAAVGVPFDPKKAVSLSEKGCDGGDQQSCTTLGALLLSGTGVSADPVRAAGLFEAACTSGSGEACHYLGGLYLLGMGVKTNPVLARAHNLTACQRKVPTACGHLGGMLETGFGYEVDLKLAVTMRERGCTGGDAHSCYKLGRIFEDGRGHPVDLGRAAKLYLNACQANEATACFRLGELVRGGHGHETFGTDPDGMYARALEIAGTSCSGGNAKSCLTVADVLRATGKLEEAGKLNAGVLSHLDDTCTRGDFTACVELGQLYANGHGVTQSAERAAQEEARACALGASLYCKN